MNTISRRQFLTGALGLAVVGAAGTYEALQHPTLRNRLGLGNSPDYSAPDAHVKTENGTLTSKYMSSPVRWTYSLPAAKPVATVFCLHGRSGNHTRPFAELHLQDMV